MPMVALLVSLLVIVAVIARVNAGELDNLAERKDISTEATDHVADTQSLSPGALRLKYWRTVIVPEGPLDALLLDIPVGFAAQWVAQEMQSLQQDVEKIDADLAEHQAWASMVEQVKIDALLEKKKEQALRIEKLERKSDEQDVSIAEVREMLMALKEEVEQCASSPGGMLGYNLNAGGIL